MEWPVFFPNVKTKSTKDLVIRLLTEQKQLTNQQLFLAIKRKFGVSVTYQAVRQALLELTEVRVLEKNSKFYSLSINWIENLHAYSKLLKKKYIDKRDIKIVDENTREVVLNSLNEMAHFILYSFKEQFFDIKNENDLYIYQHNLWFPFFSEKKRQKLREFFSVNKNLILVANKGLVNRVFATFYRRYGTVKLGVKLDQFFDMIIQGDCVARIYMPKELRERMNKVYRSKNPFNFKIIDEFSSHTYHEYPIKIIITRDKQMAQDIKKVLRSL